MNNGSSALVKPSPWGKSSSQPSSTAGQSSPLQQSAFPDLSSSTSTKRSRRSPWSNALHDNGRAAINPYPPRLQELNSRALARDDHNATVRPSRKGLFGLQDLEQLALGDAADVQIEEASTSPAAQMYGVSRVTVKDLSQSNGKGKNKAKKEVHSANGGPDIYSRHNTPWVQKGKRVAEQAGPAGLSGGGITGQADDSVDHEEAESDTEPSDPTPLDDLELLEVIAACERTARIEAAETRRASSASTSTRPTTMDSDPYAPLYSRISRDISSPDKILAASWLAPPLSEGPGLSDRLNRLPTETAEVCVDVMSNSILKTTRKLVHRLTRSVPDQRDHESLSRLLWLCVHLDFHRSYTDAYDAYQAVLRALDICSSRAANEIGLVEALARTRQLPMLAKGVAASLNLTLEQARLAGDVLTSQDLYPAAQMLRHLRTAAMDLAMEDFAVHPSVFRITELSQPLLEQQSQSFLAALRTQPEYAFLHPLSLKLSNLSSLVHQSMEVARKHSLWSNFYSPQTPRRSAPSSSSYDQALILAVTREDVLTSTVTAFASLQSWDPLRDLRIEFRGEEGVDSYSGGVKKEWFAQVARSFVQQEIVRPVGGGEEGPASQYITLNGDLDEDQSETISLLGKMMALSIYHQVPMGLRFPAYLLRFLIQGDDSSSPEQDLTDLGQLSPRMTKSLRQVLAWHPPAGMDATAAAALFESTFHLNWTATAASPSPSTPIPLLRGGAHRPVTLADRHDFVECLAQWHLYDSIEWPLNLLRQGFRSIFPASRTSSGQEDPISKASKYLSRFDADEWTLLIAGPDETVTTQLLRSCTTIFNRRTSEVGKFEDEAMLSWFWQAVLAVAAEDDAGWLLSYVTASPFLPPSYHSAANDGLSPTSSLVQPRRPLFTIHLLDADPVSQLLEKPLPLPFSSTCTSTLFLPRYRSQDECREKIRVLRGLIVGSSADLEGVRDEGGVGFGLK